MNVISHSTYSRYSEDNIEGFGTVQETRVASLGERFFEARQRFKVNKCCSRNWKWITASFAACILFLVCNIFIGIISVHGKVSRPYILIGNMIAVILKIVIFRDARSFSQLMYNFKVIDNDRNSINIKFIIKILMDCAILVVSGYITILMFNHSIYAEVNQGITSSLAILSPIFIAILTWFFIGVRMRLYATEHRELNIYMNREQCNYCHILGLLLCCGSCFLIYLKPYYRNGYLSEFCIMLGVNPPVALIVLIFLNAAAFSVKDYIFRRHMFSSMISPYRFYELISICSGVISVFIAIYDGIYYRISMTMVIEAIFIGKLHSFDFV